MRRMWYPVLQIVVGLTFLAWGASRFVDGAAALARHFGMSPLYVGVLVVGTATSAPEVLVGAVAAWQENTCLALGNALGSNITNIALVLGASAVVAPIYVSSVTLKREYGLMLLYAVLVLLLLWDLHLSRLDSLILLGALVGHVIGLFWTMRRTEPSDPLSEEWREHKGAGHPRNAAIAILVGFVVLLLGSKMLVSGAVSVAVHYHVPELIIGLTIVALGTSLPELAASVASVLKKEGDIAVGNILGSNTFNMLAVICVPGLIHPASCGPDLLTRDFPVMFVLMGMLGIMVFVRGKGWFSRGEGMLLLTCFLAYQTLLWFTATGKI